MEFVKFTKDGATLQLMLQEGTSSAIFNKRVGKNLIISQRMKQIIRRWDYTSLSKNFINQYSVHSSGPGLYSYP